MRQPALPSRKLPLAVASRFAGKAAHERPSQIRYSGEPEPGYFRLRLVRGGPWVPAIIWRPCPLILPERLETTPAPEDWCCPTERGRPLRARIGEREADPLHVWERGQRIAAAEYAWRLELRDWAERYAPAQPEAKPQQRVDLAVLPSLF